MNTRGDGEAALLLGVLALRLGLARQDALISAYNAWSQQPGRSFAGLLVESTLVSAPSLEMLQDLADRLALLQGGTREALLSLNPEDALGPLHERALDPTLRSTIDLLGLSNLTAIDSLATVAEPHPSRDPAASSRFHSLKLHARGGLGEVFLARDESLGRDVALKEIQPRYADDADSRSRFVREARITGSLEHPGIVPIYTLGCHPGGRPFYTMRFIDGTTFKEALVAFHSEDRANPDPGARSLELRRLLGRFVDVCNTIHFAHARGVIHRDIKPANIMLGRFGEAIVVDWGLGKTMGGAGPVDPSLTQSGSPMGTPAYMSPEQATGRTAEVGPTSDVYSLGATLYSLLTGRAPFEGKDLEQILADVRRGQFPRPREIRRDASRSLEAICLKAMALKPAHRYQTAGTLADEVERWLAGEPVSAYREPMGRRLWRWGRRNRWVAAMIGAASIAIVTVFLFSSLLVAPLALCLALVGGGVGAIVGVLQGKPTHGAQKGAEFGFRVGTITILSLFVLWLAYMAYLLTSTHRATLPAGPQPSGTQSAGSGRG
ncbi:serine/threonine-protein kinase [Tundrisphaera sp. TA3]|uniref:serine/threonine-protein kinase n=1 Tax=Tundrisphaera sp. TA3 TaxID=3435775 RepID=UPI003EB8064F